MGVRHGIIYLMEINVNVPIVIVAGMCQNTRAIGKENGLLWHIPADLKRFKELTLGHPIIMGRKTFESILQILGKPLPGRTNIVVTRDTAYTHAGATVAHSLEAAVNLASAEEPAEIHIGGGAEMYQQILPHVSRLHITWFLADTVGDVFFPEFEHLFTIANTHPIQAYDELQYQWIDYVKK